MTGISSPGSTCIANLIGDEVVRAPADATLGEVAQILLAGGMGAVLLGEGKPAALVSERDIVAAVALGHDPAVAAASEVASTELVWCDVDATVDEVATEMMEHYIRHILVEDAGALVGVVSARDLLGAYCSGGDAE
jgi:CBS domain-containing protein